MSWFFQPPLDPDVLNDIDEVNLSASSNIAAAAATATTARLTAPSGKSSGTDFQAGKISDDLATLPSIDLGSGKYTELEWCIRAGSGVSTSDEFEFRVTSAGVALDTYTQTPKATISASGAAVAYPAGTSSTSALGTSVGKGKGLKAVIGRSATASLGAVVATHTPTSTPATAYPSGVSSSTSLGTSIGKGKGLEDVTGLASVSTLGTSIAKGRGIKAVTGLFSTSTLGASVARGKGLSVITGRLSPTLLGAAVVKGKGVVSVSGLNSTSSYGMPTAKGKGRSIVSGLSSTSGIGTSTTKGKGTKEVSGLSATISLGTAAAIVTTTTLAQPTGLVMTIAVGSPTYAVGKGKALITGVSTGGDSQEPVITGVTQRVYYDSRNRVSKIIRTITQEV